MKRDPLPAAVGSDAAWRALHAAACEPYRQAGHWAWHWARGKLGHDPVFRGLLERGELPARARVVDIGCGQGLLASLLQGAGTVAAGGGWPAAWPAPPSAAAYCGIELARRDLARARAALQPMGSGHGALQFIDGDARRTPLPPCDVVVLLDVLHYIGHAEQQALLGRVRQALAAGGGAGRLLLRVGDAASARSYAFGLWVDRSVAALRGLGTQPEGGRPLAGWLDLLQALGYTVRRVPMNQGTPFANVLLVADLAAAAPQDAESAAASVIASAASSRGTA